MDRQAYRSFTDRLLASLSADARVLGLIACGSMAERDTRPDEHSDHDFLVVVTPGAQEDFRNQLAWLPDPGRLVCRFRETAHGVKALYDDGHLLEFAVFDPDELRLARVNQVRILLDRSDLARRMDEIVRATAEAVRAEARDDSFLIGQVVTGVLVAYGRWLRGERLSARFYLIDQALPELVRLLERYIPPGSPAALDNLSPLRRFELAYADLGAALNEVLDRPLPAAAAGLLELAERELAGRMPQLPAAALEAVRRRMR